MEDTVTTYLAIAGCAVAVITTLLVFIASRRPRTNPVDAHFDHLMHGEHSNVENTQRTWGMGGSTSGGGGF